VDWLPHANATQPSLTFATDTDTGVYHPPGDNQLALATGGTDRLVVHDLGATITGNVTATGFVGDGHQLEHIQVDNIDGLSTAIEDITNNSVTTNIITVSGNVTAAGFVGNAHQLEHVQVDNIDGLSTALEDITNNSVTTNIITVSGNVTAAGFVGNAHQLEHVQVDNIDGLSTALEDITNNSVTTNIITVSGNVAAAGFTAGNVTVDSTGSLSLGNSTRQMINLWRTEYAIGVQDYTQYYRTAGSFAWFMGGVHSNTQFDAGSGGTTMMVLTGTGRLGLNTTSPTQTLDVRGSAYITGTTYITPTITTGVCALFGDAGKLGVSVNDGYGNLNLTFNHAEGVPDISGSAYRIEAGVDTNTATMYFEMKDSVTAGTATGLSVILELRTTSTKCYTDFSSTGNITAYASDRRLKQNIAPLSNVLETIKKLNGYTFTWRDDVEGMPMRGRDLGLVAQELEGALGPDLADLVLTQAPFDHDVDKGSKSGEFYRTIHYNKLHALWAAGFKEQQEQIEDLQDTVQKQQQTIDTLIKRLDAL